MITEWIIFDVFSFDSIAIQSLVNEQASLISFMKYLAAVNSSLFSIWILKISLTGYSEIYFSNFI